MNDHELMQALRDTRRVDDAGIATVTDRHALGALREGILMTDRHTPPTVEAPRRGRRLGRRGLVSGVLALALVGGGAAYAAYTQWYVGGGGDGLTCMTTWQDPLEGDGVLDATGGPPLTGDPVADCQRYQQLSGKPPIVDPVAFERDGAVFVTPREQAPKDGRDLETTAAERAAGMRLDAALDDWVDGGRSRCYDRATAVPFMQAQITRLGLTGWSTKVMPDNRPYEDGPCGFFDTDPATRTAMFFPDREADPSIRKPDKDVASFVYDVRDALREGIADTCVSADEAEAVVERALGSQHHWPTTVVADDRARCASIDLQVGGSIQIWVYGPAVARP